MVSYILFIFKLLYLVYDTHSLSETVLHEVSKHLLILPLWKIRVSLFLCYSESNAKRCFVDYNPTQMDTVMRHPLAIYREIYTTLGQIRVSLFM
jgi:hypothetical protein